MLEKFVDTKEQLLAQSSDRHLSVNANAGSGKTTVLQKRFISLLLDDKLRVEPRELVAITFTRKAAAEIFAKIAKAIEEIIQDPKTGKTKQAKLIRIRERLNSAHISTIHSFCSSIIRDFPVESGVPPNFSELSEAEISVIIKDAITDAFTKYLTGKKDDADKLKFLISVFGKKQVERMLKQILDKRDVLPKVLKFYGKYSDEEINRMAIEGFLEFLDNNYLASIQNVQIVFETISRLNLKNEQLNVINNFVLKLAELTDILSEEIIDSNNNFNLNIEQVSDELKEQKVLTTELLLNKQTLKRFLGDEVDNLNSDLEGLSGLIQILACLDNISYQKQLIEFSRFLIKTALDVLKLIDEKKQDLGGLDFDDILLKAQDMLQNKEIAEKISKRFRFMMVDEFQDTNEIQYNIIKSLVPQLEVDTGGNEINLFIVGDPKQSIYGFRNADVRVFKKATEEIKKCNENLIENNLLSKDIISQSQPIKVEAANQSLGELGLTVSFRHLPVITAFTNQVCNTTMSRKESEFDVEYSDLICSKKIPELNEYLSGQTKILDDKLFGSVKIILSKKAEKGKEDEKVSESEMLAVHIKNIVLNTEYKYSDIAVLGKSRTKFMELTNAFQKYNIPYVLHSGKGFYEAQEVLDMISILKFLHNPSDDLALTGALRSPYFGLSDLQIVLISSSTGNTVFEKLKYVCDNNLNADKIILRAYEILLKLISYSTRLSVSHLIAHVIEMTGWYGTTAASQGRAQVVANVMKLKQYASDFEKRGFKTLFDFVEEVKLISKEDIQESEAVFITDDNAVNIMTIHAAKGLEFPIVALFNATSGRNNTDSFFIDESLGLSFKSPVYDEKNQIYKQIDTPHFIFTKNKNSLKEKAELKRLLYVALTRAKEHLIITGDLSSKSYKYSLFEIIIQGMNYDLGILPDDKIEFVSNLQTYYNGEINSKKINYHIEIIKEVEHESMIETQTINNKDLPEVLMDEIKSEVSNEVFSASRIIKFRDNFEEYSNRYILGFDDDFVLRQVQDDESQSIKNADDISAAESGTVIHFIMENISKWYDSGKIDNIIMESLFEEAEFFLHKKLNGKFRERVSSEISNMISTDLIKNNIVEILDSKHEAEFNIPILNDFFNAKIDLLFEKNGVYEVWDWKSNAITSKEEMTELAKYYEFQMKVYAYLIMLLQPEHENYTARLLFSKLAIPGAKDEEWTYRFVWTREDLIRFRSELEQSILKIKSA